jgi:hypothetical protein
VGAEALGEFAHALDRLVASLADDVCCAERSHECDAVWMTAQEDDLLGAEASGGDHAAQADGSVSDNGRSLPGANLGGDRRVMTGGHHVRRQGKKRRHQRVVFADRQDDERPVCLRDAHRLALSAVDPVQAPLSSVEAWRVQPFPAEDAGAVGVQERRDDDVADLQVADVGADGLDDADELVSHTTAGLAVFHRLVRPEIAAADGGTGDDDEGVGRFDQAGVGDVLDTDVAGAEHDSCAHRGLTSGFRRVAGRLVYRTLLSFSTVERCTLDSFSSADFQLFTNHSLGGGRFFSRWVSPVPSCSSACCRQAGLAPYQAGSPLGQKSRFLLGIGVNFPGSMPIIGGEEHRTV